MSSDKRITELFDSLGRMMSGLPERDQRKLLSQHVLHLMYVLIDEDRSHRRLLFELLLSVLSAAFGFVAAYVLLRLQR